jgi:Xaa-Pro dipeptidase
LEKTAIDVAIITDPKNVYYFTGYINASVLPLPTYLIAFKKDEPILLTGTSEEITAVKTFGGEVQTFTNYSLQERMIAYPNLAATEIKKLTRNRKFRNVGLEFWTTPETIRQTIVRKGASQQLFDLSKTILNWRKVKDADELEAIRASCELDDYAYGVIKGTSRAGMTELEAYSSAYQKLIVKAKTPSFQFFYGDFTSGERALRSGGPPTTRVMSKGETFVLDLWVTTKGYWADTCRTFVIGGEPSSDQNRILNLLKQALTAGAEELKPGNTAAVVYEAVYSVIDDAGYGSKFPHHGGHCVGLDAWEPPFIIPGSHERLKEGEVCALEPGVYIPEIGGMRIEDDYLITSSGGKSLCKFPFDL